MFFDVEIELPDNLQPNTWETVNAAMSQIGFKVKRQSNARTLYHGAYEGNPDGLRIKIDQALQDKSLTLPMAISAGADSE
jgi:hypothetical protein